MKLTKEQLAIINSSGNIKINAVAGSGKTTTIIEYAKARPAQSKILYLAFNKSVKLEAVRKFEEQGLQNVKVETAHSLAYKHIVYQNRYNVRSQGYKTNEIAELLHLKGNGEKHTEFVFANHINKFIAYFCNSDKSRVQELNYLNTIHDEKARVFVASAYEYILRQSRQFLAMMDRGEIEITHDFYLKKFQLSNPVLDYDYILFDEGQDASAAMLDVFFKQKAVKVIVGDTHQQIYGWRFAVNSLEKAHFKTFHLSTSFRFSQDIANLASGILKYKCHIQAYQETPIRGKGTEKSVKSKAVIARTNLGLLLKAIEYVTETKKVEHIYFEGNINSYTYADEGASLYDVLNLYNHKHEMIRDTMIRSMHSLDDLEEYIEKTEDVQLGMMLEIVKEYGNEIHGILKKIKSKHVENDQKHKAEMIFSTVHRCKGLEYDEIHLVNDFITEKKLESLSEEKRNEPSILTKLNEEINLLYVAVTRTRNHLHIPETLIPKEFPRSTQIHLIKVVADEEKQKTQVFEPEVKAFKKPFKPETPSVKHQTKPTYKGAYQPWTKELDEELTRKYRIGMDLKHLSEHFGRTRGAILSRIQKLQLEELYG